MLNCNAPQRRWSRSSPRHFSENLLQTGLGSSRYLEHAVEMRVEFYECCGINSAVLLNRPTQSAFELPHGVSKTHHMPGGIGISQFKDRNVGYGLGRCLHACQVKKLVSIADLVQRLERGNLLSSFQDRQLRIPHDLMCNFDRASELVPVVSPLHMESKQRAGQYRNSGCDRLNPGSNIAAARWTQIQLRASTANGECTIRCEKQDERCDEQATNTKRQRKEGFHNDGREVAERRSYPVIGVAT